MEKTEKIKKEKAPKAPKEPKAPKAPKKSKNMPEGYIGRPKPMKTKTFEFHKPTVGNWIAIALLACATAFITYIVIRLIDVAQVKDTPFTFYNVEDIKGNDFSLENDDLLFVMDPACSCPYVCNFKGGRRRLRGQTFKRFNTFLNEG